MSVAATLARASLGAVFVAHGTRKLFGWFGEIGRAHV